MHLSHRLGGALGSLTPSGPHVRLTADLDRRKRDRRAIRLQWEGRSAHDDIRVIAPDGDGHGGRVVRTPGQWAEVEATILIGHSARGRSLDERRRESGFARRPADGDAGAGNAGAIAHKAPHDLGSRGQRGGGAPAPGEDGVAGVDDGVQTFEELVLRHITRDFLSSHRAVVTADGGIAGALVVLPRACFIATPVDGSRCEQERLRSRVPRAELRRNLTGSPRVFECPFPEKESAQAHSCPIALS
jgi:hypothetical protein